MNYPIDFSDISTLVMNNKKPYSLSQWCEIYASKTGDDASVPTGHLVAYLPTRGFMVYKILYDDKMIAVYQVCGDILFWRDIAELIAVENNLLCIGTFCIVPIEAYLRLLSVNIMERNDLDDEKYGKIERFFGKDNLGRMVVASFYGYQKYTGRETYTVVQYLNEQFTKEKVIEIKNNKDGEKNV